MISRVVDNSRLKIRGFAEGEDASVDGNGGAQSAQVYRLCTVATELQYGVLGGSEQGPSVLTLSGVESLRTFCVDTSFESVLQLY